MPGVKGIERESDDERDVPELVRRGWVGRPSLISSCVYKDGDLQKRYPVCMTPFTGQIIAVVTLTASSVAQEPAAFHKPKLNLVGAAEVLSDRLRLTPATRQLSGAAWLAEKQNISNGFEVLFQFQLTAPGWRGPAAD